MFLNFQTMTNDRHAGAMETDNPPEHVPPSDPFCTELARQRTTFMTLAPEIRLQIYEMVFTELQVHIIATEMPTIFAGASVPEHIEVCFDPCHPLALLAVNKKIRRETQSLAESQPISFYVENSYQLWSRSISIVELQPWTFVAESAWRQIRSITTDISIPQGSALLKAKCKCDGLLPNLEEIIFNTSRLLVRISQEDFALLERNLTLDLTESGKLAAIIATGRPSESGFVPMLMKSIGKSMLKGQCVMYFPPGIFSNGFGFGSGVCKSLASPGSCVSVPLTDATGVRIDRRWSSLAMPWARLQDPIMTNRQLCVGVIWC